MANQKINFQCKNVEQSYYLDILKDREINFAACTGIAGSGKSTVAAYYCGQQLMQYPDKTLYLTRSVTPVRGEQLGYVKGNLEEKYSPWLAPITQHLQKYLSKPLKHYIDKKRIKFLPLAYIRGVSLDNCVIHLTEAQNISVDMLEALMTRIDYRSKLIIEGDHKQSDNRSTKFKEFCEYFQENLESFDHIHLTKSVRNKDIQKICNLFEKFVD